MINKVTFIFLLILLFSCNSNKSISDPIVFSNQEFDLEMLSGKWLINSKYDFENFVIFYENFHALYDDKRYVPYELKKDSIFIFFKNTTAKGRLIKLTKSEVDILWGDRERIKYYRSQK